MIAQLGDFRFEVADAGDELFAFALGFLGSAEGFAGHEGGAVLFDLCGEVIASGFAEDIDAVGEGLVDLGEVVVSGGEEVVEFLPGALDVCFEASLFGAGRLFREFFVLGGGEGGGGIRGGLAVGGGLGGIESEFLLEGIG